MQRFTPRFLAVVVVLTMGAASLWMIGHCAYAQEAAPPAQPFRLRLESDNKLEVWGQRIAPQDVEPIVKHLLTLRAKDAPKPKLELEVSGETVYENVVQLLDLFQKMGFESISLKTFEDAAKPAAPAKSAPLDQKTTERIEKLGGELNFSGETLVEIILFETEATDADLALLGGLSDLVGLTLTGTRITDAGLAHLEGLHSLGDLGLASTAVTDAGLAHFTGFAKLEYLSLHKTKVTDAGLVHLRGLRNLVMLNLGDTAIGNRGLPVIGELPKLGTLDLSGTQVSDGGLASLRGLKSLTDLRLANTSVSDTGLAHLQPLDNLTTLILNSTQVSGSGLRHLPVALKTLYFPHTNVDDAGLQQVAHLKRLETLVLSHTRVTDASLPHLMKLTNLRSLDLTGTRMTAAGLRRLQTALPECRVTRSDGG